MKPLPDITSRYFGWRELLQLVRDPMATYFDWRQKHGEALQFRIGPQRHCVFFSPQALGQVAKQRANQFRRDPRMMRVLRQWNGDSVLIAEGDRWLQLRRLLAPAFQPQQVVRYAATLLETVDHAFPADQVAEVEAAPAMVALAVRMFCSTVFDLRSHLPLASLQAAMGDLARAAMTDLFLPYPLPMWLPMPPAQRKRRAVATLRAFVEDLIARRGQTGKGSDLLSAMMSAADEGRQLTPTQLRDQVMTLLLAGHDTTAAGLTWLMHLLSTHPEVALRAAQEGNALPPQPKAADLAQLAYCERVVKEALRLYPPAPALLLRQALGEVEIEGFRVQRGALVHLPLMVAQRDPRFFAHPERFEPDRFLQPPAEHSYAPFGAGARICLGHSLAMLEMTLAVARLTARFHIRPAGAPALPQPELRFSLWPGWPLRLRLEPR